VLKSWVSTRCRELRLLLAESAACWSAHNAPRMGAALAYYGLLSFMPLLLVGISVAGLIFGTKSAETGIVQQVGMLIGIQRANILQALLEGAQNKADGVAATLIGTLLVMFGAGGMLIELRSALNTIWDVPLRRLNTLQEMLGVVKERLWSLALVLAIVLLLTASLLLSTFISALGALAPAFAANEVVLHLFNALLSLVATTIAFGAIYKVVPQVPLRWPDVIFGATVSSVLFTVGNVLLGIYLGKASFSSTYGAASSAVVLAIWLYYSSQIFFFGAEFTRAFARTYGSAPKRRVDRVEPTADRPRPGTGRSEGC